VFDSSLRIEAPKGTLQSVSLTSMYRAITSRLTSIPAKIRWVAMLSLVNYTLLALGIPLPHLEPIAADTQPFPCQGHRCGCRTAQQCWKSCCCMSAQQKIQWAHSRGITPPAAALAAAAQETAAPPAGSCCSRKAKLQLATCSAPGTKSSAGETVSQRTRSKSGTSVYWVSFIEAEKCHGGSSTNWLPVATSLPAHFPEVSLEAPPRVGYCRVSSQPVPLNPAYPPPAPPPRLL
jgi:hypothetical protein